MSFRAGAFCLQPLGPEQWRGWGRTQRELDRETPGLGEDDESFLDTQNPL